MQYFQILNCTGDITTCCSDYGLARILSIFKQLFSLIQIIIPVILIVMATVQLTKMVASPDDKKGIKPLLNKFLAAVIIFFIPTLVNVVLSWMPSSFEVFPCWNAAEEIDEIIKTSNTIHIRLNDKKGQSFITDPGAYDKGNPSSSDGNGTILIIAGHSYSPYCSGTPNDCRGRVSSGYDETEETRKLAKLVKQELNSIGVKADIANALMAGDSDKMNKSFYKECSRGTKLCQKYKWEKYKYVLEIHFNASSNGSASGTMLVKNSKSYSTKADKAILNAVTKHTGNRKYSDYISSIHNIRYFTNRNVPITYVEVEFYDNKSAMNKYTQKKELIAKDIASAIKEYYG